MLTTLSQIISDKGRQVQTVTPDVTVADAVRKMHELNIGALLVTEAEQLVGIFTERDVLFRVVNENLDPKSTRVAQVMTADPLAVKPTTTADQAMRIVTEKRFRHLPVVEGERLTGLVSSGDLTRSVLRDQESQIDALIGSVKAMAHGM
jgi:CBS domain-containing protein